MTEETVSTFEKVSSSHLSFLRLMALIPFKGCKLNFFGTRLLAIYFHVFNTMTLTMWMGYGCRMLIRKSVEVDYICELIAVIATFFRYVLLYINREKVAKLVELCRELWFYITEDEIANVKFFERKAYYFRNFLLGNTLVAVTIIFIRMQIIEMSTSKKMLPFRFYVEVEEEPMFAIAKALQIITVYTMTVLVAGLETASLYLIMMACGYLRSVQNRLLSFTDHEQGENLIDKPKKKYFHGKSELEMIRTCAKFHQKILVYCEEIEKLMRNIFFITVFATVYNMSLAGLVLIQKYDSSFVIAGIFLMNLVQFLICQWSPENLLIESDAITDAAYFASYRQSKYTKETNRILFFVMSRAQKPMQLTAGGFVKLSMETFAAMSKNAFSFFTILKSFSS